MATEIVFDVTTTTYNNSNIEMDDSIDPQKYVPYIFVPVYISLFLIGFFGNLWVISVMVNIYKLFLNRNSVDF